MTSRTRMTSAAALAAAAFILALPLAASAQSIGTAAPFTVSVSPQYPVPYGTAVLTVLSTSLNLANATLAVSVNGKSVYAGNVRPVSVALGSAGHSSSVKVTVSSNGTARSQTILVTPQDVSLVAEPIASVPPLYPGKSQVPLEGTTRVVAVANLRTARGTQVSPAALSYSWTVDGTQEASASGIGKNASVVPSPLIYRERAISVTVTSQDGTLAGGASLVLDPVEPTLRIYEADPLAGIRFERALSGSYQLAGTETSLYGAVFSFPTGSGAPTLAWFLNGSAAGAESSITLRSTGTGKGTAHVSLTGSAGSFTSASAALDLSFGASPNTNFFGL